MKLTKRGEYALRTLIRLGIAERKGRGCRVCVEFG
jgi:DNA-binding IscR family transcriptional regulator